MSRISRARAALLAAIEASAVRPLKSSLATDDAPHPDITRLNAFVDGELTPSERAAVAAQIRAQPNFARAHATLARLKACIGENADATLPPVLVISQKRPRRLALGIGVAGLAICVLFLLTLFAATDFLTGSRSVPLAGQEAVVTLASLPASPVIPRLDAAGLTLEDLKVDRIGDVRLLVAFYRGPHGCVVDLRVSPVGSVLPPGAGSSRHSWNVGPLAYELVAHGMPGWRFGVIAEAAERETRGGPAHDAVRRRLREARAAAPPCAG